MSDAKQSGLGSLRRGAHDAAPDIDAVREFYRALPEIQPADDRWLRVQNDWIQQFLDVELQVPQDAPPRCCVNLGSGGLSYGIAEPALLHVDFDPKRFAEDQHVLIADIQRLPPQTKGFSYGFCVGSVLNHCDAAAVIAGAGAAISLGGRFVLEFETSASLELVGSRHFNRSATVINTFYQGNSIKLWAYSEQYVKRLLEANGFAITRRSSCHHISPLVYGISRSSNFAALFHVFDSIARRLPILRRCACHVIYACRKTD